MTIDQVAPELRALVRRFPRLPVSNSLARWVARRAVQYLTPSPATAGVHRETLKTSDGLQARVHTPQGKRSGAALLWIHGGGLVLGSAVQDDLFCAQAALALGVIVVAGEYRLAPESPFPAALDDCAAAWAWLHDAAPQLGVDPSRVAVGGESAGGGLAAGLVQRIHDAGGVQPAAQWLFSPMLDDRTAANTELDAINHPIWNNRQNRYGWQAYLGVEQGAAQLPDYASPARRGDLRGLPPTWIGVGDIELFYAEGRTYAERLMAAGVDCTLDLVAGAPHAVEAVARESRIAQEYVARAHEWLRLRLAPGGMQDQP